LLLEPGQNQTSWNLSEYDVRKVNKDNKADASSIINKLENLEDEYRTSFTQEKLFAELTNGYENTGIYIQNGFLFINADKIATGTIAS
jgi:hypothetical protein